MIWAMRRERRRTARLGNRHACDKYMPGYARLRHGYEPLLFRKQKIKISSTELNYSYLRVDDAGHIENAARIREDMEPTCR